MARHMIPPFRLTSSLADTVVPMFSICSQVLAKHEFPASHGNMHNINPSLAFPCSYLLPKSLALESREVLRLRVAYFMGSDELAIHLRLFDLTSYPVLTRSGYQICQKLSISLGFWNLFCSCRILSFMVLAKLHQEPKSLGCCVPSSSIPTFLHPRLEIVGSILRPWTAAAMPSCRVGHYTLACQTSICVF
jgi:hypothetical protein